MKKRWLSILLVCGMLLTTLPSAVFAEGEDGAECVCTTACTAEVQERGLPHLRRGRRCPGGLRAV